MEEIEPKPGELWKRGNKVYQVYVVGERLVILKAVHGKSDDGMVFPLAFWPCGMKRVVKDGEK